ncbi:hypothetical protein [Iningainema tapete]|uniref:Uncharacterized protein n=1 Tax=Iningainema tapete BLCC-T55 TaxID=2748662 RepID=A0A8J6XMP2_9CYAN|nr:hypothetical protein [Iningainema tapete]MBD2773781.1 hypothetical protein [Iningainema tapete BLCC-T55]
MNDSQPLTIQLSLQERSTLIAEAQRRNLSLDALALELIKDGIAQMQSLKRQAALNALECLDELISHLPLVDTIEIVRASREELEQRSKFSQ